VGDRVYSKLDSFIAEDVREYGYSCFSALIRGSNRASEIIVRKQASKEKDFGKRVALNVYEMKNGSYYLDDTGRKIKFLLKKKIFLDNVTGG
jgi:hypothetical protein